MKIEVNIKKKLGNFNLDINFSSDSLRTGILGRSGCGKSVTLKAIAGIITPDSGRIVVNNRVLYDSDKNINLKPQDRKVGYLFQNYALFPTMTVEKNISVVIKNKANKKEKINSLISKFGLEEIRNKFPSQISGGQQQRTALARLIASNPEIIMLDEAFSALDSHLREQLQLDMINFFKECNITALIVSHDRDEIYKMTDKIVVVDDGVVCSSGTTKGIFKSTENVATAMLTGCKNISEIEVLGNRKILAKDWNIVLNTNVDVDISIKYVGVRAHDFNFDKGDNEFTAKVINTVESLFENVYILEVAGGKKNIWLKRSNEINTEIGSKVFVNSESLMLLK